MEFRDKVKAIQGHFPVFQQLELVHVLAENSQFIALPEKHTILHIDSYIKVIPLVLSGSVKVFREDAKGRDVFLYYIKPGESCAFTLASTFKQEKSKIKAISLEPTELLALPVEEVFNVNRKYPNWHYFVFDTFTKRFDEFISAFEQVVFHKLDDRLINYLKARANMLESNTIPISHQEIANDLATSREVISRLLKQLEKENLVLLSRGQIVLTD